MSNNEPGLGTFCGPSAGVAAARATGVEAAVTGVWATAATGGAWPEIIAKKAFCAASLDASEGAAWGVGGRVVGRIGFTVAGMVNAAGPQTAPPASTQG